MIIRKATLKDVPAIVEMWKDFMKYHYEIIIKKDKRFKLHLDKKKDSPEIFEKYVKERINSKEAVIHVAETDGKLVGYSLIYVDDNIPLFEIEKIGHVGDLYVEKGYRSQRISSKFKDTAIEWFKKKGVKHMSLSVYPDNEHAHSIYKKWGFFDFHINMRKEL